MSMEPGQEEKKFLVFSVTGVTSQTAKPPPFGMKPILKRRAERLVHFTPPPPIRLRHLPSADLPFSETSAGQQKCRGTNSGNRFGKELARRGV